jgi:hypothetical protein
MLTFLPLAEVTVNSHYGINSGEIVCFNKVDS